MAELYPFQRDAVGQLLAGKHIVISSTGSGKSAMSMKFAELMVEQTGKCKILVVTTASKVRAKNAEGDDDFTADAKRFCGEDFCELLPHALELISWHKLSAWTNQHYGELDEYIYIFDECQRAGSGVSSGMGKAFLKITKHTEDWAGFTGTPGDNWLKFYPYFQATGLVWNKTSFMRTYAQVQTFKGYPEVIGWNREDELKEMWAEISYAPDTSKVMNELPKETHKVITFKKPSTYNKILKTRTNADGELLDTSGALCSELRRVCFTKDKQEWIKDFIEGLGEGCVMFYNFTKTGDLMTSVIQKAMPKGARVWRIDGKHHEIPTAETIGKYDVVVCQWQSGSEALNLQYLRAWVSVEPHYSYSTSIQARGRIRRIGQDRPQIYYYLKTENTIEDAIYDALKGKSDFSADNWCIGEGIDF